MNTWQEVTNNINTWSPSAGVVINHIFGAGNNGDSWSEIFVIYNSSFNTNVSLPAGNWKVAMEKADPSEGNDRIVSGTIEAEGTAVTVLYKD